MTPDDVAALLRREGSGLSADDYDEASQPPGARERRTALLADVLKTCQQAWYSGSEELDVLAEQLGDGSRDVAWRLPLGDSGILDFFLGALAIDATRSALLVHSLRLVGNSCADTDENRERVVRGHHLPSIIRRLGDEGLIPFTIPVLFNILIDYEPAQLAASQARLNCDLVKLLTSPGLSDYTAFITYFCRILSLLAAQDGESDLADPRTVDVLLTLATSPPFRDDPDDFTSLASAAAAYLAGERFQTSMVAGNGMSLFLAALQHSQQAFQPEVVDDPEVAQRLKQLRTSLLNSLSDLSANDSFAGHHPLPSPVPQNLLSWLRGPVQGLQSAACLALGNLSRSDAVSVPLVQTYQAHAPLVRLIASPATKDAQALHSALSFLKNLAIPSENKALLGDLLDPGCVPRVFSLDTLPQVQYAAVSLTRLLVANCPANVRRICSPLSADTSSPLHARSGIHSIAGLFNRSDAEPTQLEAARSIAAICRVLHTAPNIPEILPEWDPSKENNILESSETMGLGTDEGSDDWDEDSRWRAYFYRRHAILSPLLALLLRQKKWPVIRSEALFVYALMCHSKDGAAVVLAVVGRPHPMNTLSQAITGHKAYDNPPQEEPQLEAAAGDPAGPLSDSRSEVAAMADGLDLEPQQVDPAQAADMARVDRENGLVLCTELLRNWGTDQPQLRISMLQQLVKEGTELVARDKERRAQLQQVPQQIAQQ